MGSRVIVVRQRLSERIPELFRLDLCMHNVRARRSYVGVQKELRKFERSFTAWQRVLHEPVHVTTLPPESVVDLGQSVSTGFRQQRPLPAIVQEPAVTVKSRTQRPPLPHSLSRLQVAPSAERHGSSCATLTPRLAANDSLQYVVPSHPHTGA